MDASPISNDEARRQIPPTIGLQQTGAGLGWVEGFEPSATGTTIRRSTKLSYTHREGETYSVPLPVSPVNTGQCYRDEFAGPKYLSKKYRSKKISRFTKS